MDTLASLPRIVRWARRHADMSQRQLARWSGVPKSTIADVESGRCRVHVDTAEQLLATMGLEVSIARQDGGALGPPVVDERRDCAGRLVPPHLDTRQRRDHEVDLRARVASPPSARRDDRSGGQRGGSPLTWRCDREVRDVLRRYGCFGDSPFATIPRRFGGLDPRVGISDLWFRGWPYDEDLAHADPAARQRAHADLQQGLRRLLGLGVRSRDGPADPEGPG